MQGHSKDPFCLHMTTLILLFVMKDNNRNKKGLRIVPPKQSQAYKVNGDKVKTTIRKRRTYAHKLLRNTTHDGEGKFAEDESMGLLFCHLCM